MDNFESFIDGITPGNYFLTKSMELTKINTSGTLWYLKKFLVLYDAIFLSDKIKTQAGIENIIQNFDDYINSLPNSQSSSDQTFTINATEILKAWFFPMYESYSNSDKYYVFYLAQDMRIYFFNVIDDKMMYPSDATFTEIPNGAAFRINTDNDTMFFASSADQTVGLNGMGIQTYENIPKFVSGCWYGPYLFLITIGDNNELQ